MPDSVHSADSDGIAPSELQFYAEILFRGESLHCEIVWRACSIIGCKHRRLQSRDVTHGARAVSGRLRPVVPFRLVQVLASRLLAPFDKLIQANVQMRMELPFVAFIL